MAAGEVCALTTALGVHGADGIPMHKLFKVVTRDDAIALGVGNGDGPIMAVGDWKSAVEEVDEGRGQ